MQTLQRQIKASLPLLLSARIILCTDSAIEKQQWKFQGFFKELFQKQFESYLISVGTGRTLSQVL